MHAGVVEAFEMTVDVIAVVDQIYLKYAESGLHLAIWMAKANVLVPIGNSWSHVQCEVWHYLDGIFVFERH